MGGRISQFMSIAVHCILNVNHFGRSMVFKRDDEYDPRYPELTHSAVCASPSLHPAVVVPLLVPELPVVPGISALIHTVR